MTLEQRLMEISACLQCAVMQSAPSDDQIIMGRVREALIQAKVALAEIRMEPIEALVETLTEAA